MAENHYNLKQYKLNQYMMLGKNLDCLCFLLFKVVVNNNNLTTVILYVRGTGVNKYFFK